MSFTQSGSDPTTVAFTVMPGETSRAVAPPTRSGGRGSRPGRGRRWPAVVLAVAVVAAGGGGWWWFRGSSDAGPADHTPVVLPPTLGGLPYNAEVDFAPGWAPGAREEFYGDDHAFGGAAYRAEALPQLNLIVARGHFPQSSDLLMSRGPYTAHGPVQCTKRFNLSHQENPDGEGAVIDSLTVCFRVERTLTVSVLALGSRAPEEQVVAAVNEAWELQ